MPSLAGLHLVEPVGDASSAQVVYLDFDGAAGVDYDGPIAVRDLDVPALETPGALAGSRQQIAASVVAALNDEFASGGVVFTQTRPAEGMPYSTIYVGGDGSAFAPDGRLAGLAEAVDVGNHNRADEAFVFADVVARGSGEAGFAAALAQTIAHETGHLLGYAHDESQEHLGILGEVAASITALNSNSGSAVAFGDGTFASNAARHAGFWDTAQDATDETSRAWDEFEIPAFADRPAVDRIDFQWTVNPSNATCRQNWAGFDVRGVWTDPFAPVTQTAWAAMNATARYVTLGNIGATTYLSRQPAGLFSGNFSWPLVQAASIVYQNPGQAIYVGYRENPEGSDDTVLDDSSRSIIDAQMNIYYVGKPTALVTDKAVYDPQETVRFSWDADTTGTSRIGFRLQLSRDPQFPNFSTTEYQLVDGKSFQDVAVEPGRWFWRVQARNKQIDSLTRFGIDWATSEWSDMGQFDVNLPTISVLAVNDSEGSSGQKNFNFPVQLSSPLSVDVSFDYATVDGQARTSDNDYIQRNGRVTIPAGQTGSVISVPVVGDTKFEADEGFFLMLGNAQNGRFEDTQIPGWIQNDDAQPRLFLGDARYEEGTGGAASTFSFPLTLSEPSGLDVLVPYATEDGSAKAGEDYEAAAGEAVIPAGHTNGTIAIRVVADANIEPDETFLVRLGANVQNAAVAHDEGLGTIVNDDLFQEILVSSAEIAVPEGAWSIFHVRLALPPTTPLTVTIAKQSGGDPHLGVAATSLVFNASDWNLDRPVLISAGQDDDVSSGTAAFTLSAPGLGTKTLQATEIEDERLSLVVAPAVLAVAEGGSAQFLVKLNGQPAGPVTVSVVQQPGGDPDLVAGTDVLSFTPQDWNVEKPLTIGAAEDDDETNGTASFRLDALGLDPVVVTAQESDNDQLALVVSPSSFTVPEGQSAQFTVKLNRAPSGPVIVSVLRQQGGDVDLVAATTVLSFDAGDWFVEKPVIITAAHDVDASAGTATFLVSAAGLAQRTVVVAEADDDPQGVSRLIDDGASGFSRRGSWSIVRGIAGYGDDYLYTAKGSGRDTATWTFSNLPSGPYEVLASWTTRSNRATNAPYKIVSGKVQKTVRVNQRGLRADAAYAETDFQRLSIVQVTGGRLTVSLGDGANGVVVADAVWVRSAAGLTAAAPAAPGARTAALAPAALEPVISAVLADWHARGVSADLLQRLTRVEFALADLPPSYLGMAVGNKVYLDRDAAGHGWFVDPTPAEASEFAPSATGQEQRAVDSAALDRMDLASVVSHELGHVAGLEDLASEPGRLMNAALRPGVRRTLGPAEVDALLAAGR